MSNQAYIIVFILAGLAWAGLMALGVALWIGFNHLIKPEPKPTAWERAWEDIEKELSK